MDEDTYRVREIANSFARWVSSQSGQDNARKNCFGGVGIEWRTLVKMRGYVHMDGERVVKGQFVLQKEKNIIG